MAFDPDRWRKILELDEWNPDLPPQATDDELDGFEHEWGVVFPAGYRWILTNYPGVELAPRAGMESPLHVPVVDRLPLGWLVKPTNSDLHIEVFASQNVLSASGLGAEMEEWERQLITYCCAENGPYSRLSLDFMFDPHNPPVVQVDYDDNWPDAVSTARSNAYQGRDITRYSQRKVRFVADSFDALIELPHLDPWTEGPIGEVPEATRALEWAAWRNERILRLTKDWDGS